MHVVIGPFILTCAIIYDLFLTRTLFLYNFCFLIQVAVAVKTLKLGSSVDEKIDFLSEADMMKRFDHKNIVKLLGVCTRNEPVYTVMEFMLYGDLKT